MYKLLSQIFWCYIVFTFENSLKIKDMSFPKIIFVGGMMAYSLFSFNANATSLDAIYQSFNQITLGKTFKQICGTSGRSCTRTKNVDSLFCDSIFESGYVAYKHSFKGVQYNLIFDPFGILVAKSTFINQSIKPRNESWLDSIFYNTNSVINLLKNPTVLTNRNTEKVYGMIGDEQNVLRFYEKKDSNQGLLLDQIGYALMMQSYRLNVKKHPSLTLKFIDHNGQVHTLDQTSISDIKNTKRCKQIGNKASPLVCVTSKWSVFYRTYPNTNRIASVTYSEPTNKKTEAMEKLLELNPNLIKKTYGNMYFEVNDNVLLGSLSVFNTALGRFGEHRVTTLTPPQVIKTYERFHAAYEEGLAMKKIEKKGVKLETDSFGFIH